MSGHTALDRHLRGQAGGITILGLFLAVTALVLGGIAVDVGHAITVRTQLQAAADAAAHAALYTRVEYGADTATARQKALDIVEASYPAVIHGDLLRASDIDFGHYDIATGGFKVDQSSTDAAMVRTDRIRARGNPVGTFFLGLAGFKTFNIERSSVFIAYDDPCLRQGWVAEDRVDAQSNNNFYDGFCVHSNNYVSVNQNNFWQKGVVVSMPDKSRIDVPAGSFSHNPGLPEALRSAYMNLRILRHLDTIFKGIADPNSDYYRSYLTNSNMWDVSPGNLTPSDFKAGRINRINCGTLSSSLELPEAVQYAGLDMFQLVQFAHDLKAVGNGKGNGNGGGNGGGASSGVTIDASSTVLSNLAIYTDCEIKFANNSALENVVIYDTNTSDMSINAPHGLRLGANDNCDPGGGVQIMTKGGFQVAAGLEIYSSQVIALGPIQFAAQANGVEGGSFISGSTIDGTSNTDMSACPVSGVENNFSVKSFRMAG